MGAKQFRRLCRRTDQEKQTLIEQWKRSHVSITAFCKQEGIAPSNFYLWRKRYEGNKACADKPTPAFIDLSSLNKAREHDSQWRIVLKLGDGIELNMSQS